MVVVVVGVVCVCVCVCVCGGGGGAYGPYVLCFNAERFSLRNHFPTGVIKDQPIGWNKQQPGPMQVKELSFSKNLDQA